MLLLAVLAATPPPSALPRGNDHFRLGMTRAQVDSAVAARGLEVVNDGGAFLVCGSDDPAVEYEQYSFFQAPHGMTLLWRVTVGYRLGSSRADLEAVRDTLVGRLGPPASDVGGGPPRVDAAGTPHPAAARQLIWVDPLTAVQLGARWGEEHERRADRMLVTWTDRRLQRLIEARRKQGRSEGSGP